MPSFATFKKELLNTMWFKILSVLFIFLLYSNMCSAQIFQPDYFRNPLNIKMELVANFGELRNNHWHMGLDIRTQQRENLPVHAAAAGYISKIKIEPGGFGRAIYINHPNGLTTLYAHLNNFTPAIDKWVKEQQYKLESWAVELIVPPQLFPLSKGQFFAYSGNTGGSAGPHVHFEIRDTKTDKCLNPLLFRFPLSDNVPPTISRLAMYDRSRSVYSQSPQILPIKKTGSMYGMVKSDLVKVGSNRISFAIGATDRLSGSSNPNGVYSAQVKMDGNLVSGFILNNIGYDETRYMNAHTDYRYKTIGGSWLQHLSPMPGDPTSIYNTKSNEGVIVLNDEEAHLISIEVKDAAQNISVIQLNVQYDPNVALTTITPITDTWIPNYINAFEHDYFEAYSSETTVYDTVNVTYKKLDGISAKALGAAHYFLSSAIPAHDSFLVRLHSLDTLNDYQKNCTVILSTSGNRKVVKKARWQGNWVWARFRQFGTFQAFIDDIPPTINAPAASGNRIVFTPRDNFNSIRKFRAELDGKWLRFTNNGGKTWIYNYDEKFAPGTHELKVMVEDEAGNITNKVWTVTR